MAVAVVHSAEGPEGAAKELTITSATKGNLLVGLFNHKETGLAVSDNLAKGAWTIDATTFTFSGTFVVSVAWKVAEGGETLIKTNLTNEGICYWELSGAATTSVVDVAIIGHEATAKEDTTEPITTTSAGDIILMGVASTGAGGLGVNTGWTASNAGSVVNISTAGTRLMGGSYIPGTTLSAVTFTAKWTTTRTVGTVVCAFKVVAGTTEHKIEASLSFAGTLPRDTNHGLSAGLSFTANPGRSVQHGFLAGLTFTGTLAKNISHALAAGLSFAGHLGRATARQFAAGLSFAGIIGRNTLHGLQATLSFLGEVVPSLKGKFVQKLSAALSFQGELQRRSTHQLPASLTPSGSLPRAITRPITASVSFTGSLPRTIIRTLQASLAPVVSAGRNVRHQLAATLSPSGGLAIGFTRPLTATLSFAGSLPRNTSRGIQATLSFAGGLQRRITYGLRAALSFLGGLVPHGGKPEAEHPALFGSASDASVYASGAVPALAFSSDTNGAPVWFQGTSDTPAVHSGVTAASLVFSDTEEI